MAEAWSLAKYKEYFRIIQVGRGLERSLIQPPAQSRVVSSGIRPGAQGFMQSRS